MNGQVFLVSEFMDGKPLSEVFKSLDQSSEIDSRIHSDQANSYKFNLENFQRLAIFSFVTVPEDSRPQNYLVRKISKAPASSCLTSELYIGVKFMTKLMPSTDL